MVIFDSIAKKYKKLKMENMILPRGLLSFTISPAVINLFMSNNVFANSIILENIVHNYYDNTII